MNKKSFTLIELLVTIAIISILATISFVMLPVYKRKAGADAAAREVKDVISRVQNLALSPEDLDDSHYILYLNTEKPSTAPYTITPYFMRYNKLSQKAEKKCCFNLSEGEYCIAKEINITGNLDASLAMGYDPEATEEWQIPADRNRVCIARGKLDVDDISANPIVGPCNVGWPGIYCDIPFCSGAGPSKCCNCEEGLFKLHFRAYDGQIGINGQYFDVNSDFWNSPDKATIKVTVGGESKVLEINTYTGEIYIK